VNSVSGAGQIVIDAAAGQNTQLFLREAGTLKSAMSYLPSDSTTRFWNNNINGIIMTDKGGVGIGNDIVPAGTLHVQGTAASRGTAGTAFFVAPDIGAIGSHIHHGANGDWYVRSASAAGKVILQDTGGNVGVGTASPTAFLHVLSNAASVGTGTAVFQSRHILNGDVPSHVHFGPTGDWFIRSADRSGNVFMQDTGGNVSIGGGTASLGRLVVKGTGNHTIGNHYLINQGGAFGPFVGSFPVGDVSIYSTHGIHASFLRAFSDARIKNIQGRSDTENDLEILEQIEITDYTLKDFIEKGNRPNKKVIGQQLEEVYPQAVATTVDVIPDIYVKAPIKDGWVSLVSDLEKGDRVRLISDSSDGTYDILEVSPSGFRTEFQSENGDVFVFGREVDDFRVVDYQAVSMLNISATQELAKQVRALRKSESRIAELEKTVARVEVLEAKASQVDALERQVTELKQLLTKWVEQNSQAQQALGEYSTDADRIELQ
jgi:hypothetical protein